MEPKNEDVKEQIRKLIGYLQNNQERIHYKGDRIGGYPIGSGGIESANKFICHTRLKRSGAWWLKENSNGMLRLRCSIANGTFDEAFSKYVTKEKAKRFFYKLVMHPIEGRRPFRTPMTCASSHLQCPLQADILYMRCKRGSSFLPAS